MEQMMAYRCTRQYPTREYQAGSTVVSYPGSLAPLYPRRKKRKKRKKKKALLALDIC